MWTWMVVAGLADVHELAEEEEVEEGYRGRGS